MAKHSDVKIGSTWTVRIGGSEVPCEVLAERQRGTGRYEYTLRNTKTGRTLTRGSGALRSKVAGQPAAANPAVASHEPAQSPFAAPTPVSPEKKTRRAPPPRARKLTAPQPPAAPSPPVPSPATPEASFAPLPSLRGSRTKRPASPATRRATTPAAKPAKPDYPSKLAESLCKAILKTDGSEWRIRAEIANVFAAYSASKFGLGGF